MKDVIKALVAVVLYTGFAPMFGVWLAGRRLWQRVIFALMIIMTGLRPGNFTFMIQSVETYRGHAKGFEVSLIEVLAIVLIVAVLNAPPGAVAGKRRVPGLGLYLFWCSIALFSFLGSPEPSYAWMAAARFFKGALIFAAAALYLRNEDDLKWAVGALAATLAHHGVLTLKMRVVDGMFQIKGWFEHQNPMAMWCYLGALPVFALLLHPQVKGRFFWLCLAGYGGAGIAILVSVSRASLAIFAVGSACLLLVALMRGVNRRALGISGLAVFAAIFTFFFGLDSFKARLAEVEQSAEEVEEDLRDIPNCDIHLDVGKIIEALPLKFGDDYTAVYDSTMARFWFKTEEAKQLIEGALATIKVGRILPERELRALRAPVDDHRFGEFVFLVEEGVLIVPSHMGERPIRAMHGYHPDDPQSYATLLTNRPELPCEVTDIPHLHRLMLDAIDRSKTNSTPFKNDHYRKSDIACPVA